MGNTIVGVGELGVDLLVPLPLLLPEEVLIEILLWVPVISLLRFKSVSKSWRDLIQSPYFIHIHTTNTFNSSSSSSSNSKQQQQQQQQQQQLGGGGGGGGDTFILQSSPFKFDADGRWVRERKMFMLSIGGPGGGGDVEVDDDQVVFKLDNLEFPPYYKDFPWTPRRAILMVGSCNGLICIHDTKRRDVSLWNPATRQFRILPKSSITFFQEEDGIGKFAYDFVAFGFDVKTKDYKVVQVSCFGPTYIDQWRPECIICRVQVYSLSTDSWRLLEGITSLPAKPIHVSTEDKLGLYLNGSYFFVGRKCPPKLLSIEEINQQGEIRNDNLMVSFDFTKEILTTMQFPDHDNRYELLITHLGDKIALFTTRIKSSFGPEGDDESRSDCDDDDDYENYDIWVLNELVGGDVNKESWAKLHSFRIKGRVAREWILPRGILNNGKFALIETRTEYDDVFNELHLLNLVTKEPKQNFPMRDRALRACFYKYSLVSIIGGNGTAAANRVVGDAMCPIVNLGYGIENHIFMKEDGEEHRFKS